MKNLAEGLIKFRVLIIVIFVVVSLLMAIPLKDSEVDPDVENMLPDHLKIHLKELEEKFGGMDPRILDLLLKIGVKRWRVATVFPKGRAKDNPLFQLTNQEFRQVFDFIREVKKLNVINVNYGCEGFLGSYEKDARNYPFFCRAGVNVSSVLCDGSISACPSLRGDYIQGNIYKDDLWDVWQNRYQVMRDRSWAKIGDCKKCKYWRYCEGSSLHLRDEKTKELAYCHVQRLEDAGA